MAFLNSPWVILQLLPPIRPQVWRKMFYVIPLECSKMDLSRSRTPAANIRIGLIGKINTELSEDASVPDSVAARYDENCQSHLLPQSTPDLQKLPQSVHQEGN